jgi:hypothetical protein
MNELTGIDLLIEELLAGAKISSQSDEMSSSLSLADSILELDFIMYLWKISELGWEHTTGILSESLISNTVCDMFYSLQQFEESLQLAKEYMSTAAEKSDIHGIARIVALSEEFKQNTSEAMKSLIDGSLVGRFELANACGNHLHLISTSIQNSMEKSDSRYKSYSTKDFEIRKILGKLDKYFRQMQCNFEIKYEKSEYTINANFESTYRWMFELMEHSIQHGKATKCKVKIGGTSDRHIIDMMFDGEPFDENCVHKPWRKDYHGIPAAKRIIDAHRGTLDYRTNADLEYKGAGFTAIIPKKQEKSLHEAPDF